MHRASWVTCSVWVLIVSGCTGDAREEALALAARDISAEMNISVSVDQLMIQEVPTSVFGGHYLVANPNISEDDPRPVLVYHLREHQVRRVTDVQSWFREHRIQLADVAPQLLCEEAFRLQHWLSGTELEGYVLDGSIPARVEEQLVTDEVLDSLLELPTTVRVAEDGRSVGAVVSCWAVEIGRAAEYRCVVDATVPQLTLVFSLDGLGFGYR